MEKNKIIEKMKEAVEEKDEEKKRKKMREVMDDIEELMKKDANLGTRLILEMQEKAPLEYSKFARFQKMEALKKGKIKIEKK